MKLEEIFNLNDLFIISQMDTYISCVICRECLAEKNYVTCTKCFYAEELIPLSKNQYKEIIEILKKEKNNRDIVFKNYPDWRDEFIVALNRQEIEL